jgi:hypothetical protein
MNYSLEIISENGKNYFLVFHNNKRFLVRRINAVAFISTDLMDPVEIYRNGSIIFSANCYRLLGEVPVYWIEYSELAAYRALSNISCPKETLYAEDFLPGDKIFSNIDVQKRKGEGYESFLSLFNFIETSMEKVSQQLSKSNIGRTVFCNGFPALFKREQSNEDVLGIKTYVVPIELC